MRIIPVLDVKDGLVVRGVAGQRQAYRPVVSRLSPSAQPLEVAHAFRDHFGLSDLYVADLDALAGKALKRLLCRALRADGFRLAVDAGIRHAVDGDLLAGAGIESLVAGLETMAGPAALAELCQRVGGERVVFSLDLKDGQPLVDLGALARGGC